MTGRKQNMLGRSQLSVLRWTSSAGRDVEYIYQRMGRHGSPKDVIASLLKRGLIHEVDGIFFATDHGKAALLPEDEYKKWLLDWGKA